MMTEMLTGMVGCESPPKEEVLSDDSRESNLSYEVLSDDSQKSSLSSEVLSDDSQVSNQSSDLSSGSSDLCSSPPQKRLCIDHPLPENYEDAEIDKLILEALVNIHGLDIAAMTEKFGPDFLSVGYSTGERRKVYRPLNETYAELALQFLKDTQGEDYEFISMRSMYTIAFKGIAHINFFARVKGSSKSVSHPTYLYYAEMAYNHGHEVLSCSVVRYYGPRNADSADVGSIVIHPEGMTCSDCELYNYKGIGALSGLCDSDEEF